MAGWCSAGMAKKRSKERTASTVSARFDHFLRSRCTLTKRVCVLLPQVLENASRSGNICAFVGKIPFVYYFLNSSLTVCLSGEKVVVHIDEQLRPVIILQCSLPYPVL